LRDSGNFESIRPAPLRGLLSGRQEPNSLEFLGLVAVELRGDLNGKVLYHVTTELDYTKGTLVKTGDQVFSGTIVGSEPVMIHGPVAGSAARHTDD
jgi:hypothetical protein